MRDSTVPRYLTMQLCLPARPITINVLKHVHMHMQDADTYKVDFLRIAKDLVTEIGVEEE